MKKRKIILIISVISLLIGLLLINRNNKTFVQDGVIYALLIDGKKSNAFPEKGLYKVNTKCNNAHGRWNYDEWKLEIDDIKGEISCDLSFESIEKIYVNDYIIGLAGTTQGDGQIVNEKGYRYEGKNPTNYIWFNNELWRIIGAMDSESHGISDTNLVKIMRDSSIGGIAWDKDGSNIWASSSLKKLLNPIDGDDNSGAYYKKKNGTSSGYCYGRGSTGNTTITTVCNYSQNGINENYRKMIKKVTWYNGGSSSASVTNDTMFKNEKEWTYDTGHIGLIYASDYGYTVPETICPRTTTLSSYDKASCAGQSWMYGKGRFSTLSRPSSSVTSFFRVNDDGRIIIVNAFSGYAIYPTLYLNENVYVLDGGGSINDPYIIGM